MTLTHPSPTQDVLATAAFDHERVLITTGQRSGLTICVAVHSTKLGQALGGARVWQYDSWADALYDALRLSSAMTLKNAVAGINRGGGKSVVYVPRGVTLDAERTHNAMLDLGDAVESLNGAYMTAEDVGTSAELMAVVAERTAHVCGLPPEQGGVGEPADATAAGVYAGLQSTLEALFGSRDVAGRHIVIAGLGQVGGRLARHLAADGATLTVADVNPARRELADQLSAAWVDPADAHRVKADLFVPCGLGGVLTPTVIDELQVSGVVGAANNQLASRDCAARLRERGILWAPDFVVNGGGVIFLALASEGADQARIDARVNAIGDTIAAIYREADANDITTLDAAERIARSRLEA
ncbi:Glu/Leu/Phe/Val dehydrogenase family protein [Salinibacterium sp. ZJ454]|uniref:Glu/Leu/Phe/Val dehydrogenase family protein n=1 Tax=Salinibacterium sp. ZJ454 TaxID=2708339 RepID=UPI00141F3175|nr:Glu/Leu/Phe/Val dehydrogenase family protein [Salinibacterium sp. ZJ454]